VIATDSSGRVIFLNAEAQRLTGWRGDEATGRPLLEVFRIVNERTQQPAEDPAERVLRTGKAVGLANHTVLVSKGGRRTPIDDSAAPIRLAGGSVSGVVLVFRDVTTQRKAQEASARLAAIVQSSGDAIFAKSPRGLIETWNAAAEQLFGYQAEEIIGKHAALLFPPERLGEEDHILELLRHGKQSEHLERFASPKTDDIFRFS